MKWCSGFFKEGLMVFMQSVVAPEKCFTYTLQSELTFFESSQPFRCFIMLSSKFVTFYVVLTFLLSSFSCIFCTSFSAFPFPFMFSVKFWSTVYFSFSFSFMLVLLEGVVIVVVVRTDTVFVFIAGHICSNNTSSRLDSSLNKE